MKFRCVARLEITIEAKNEAEANTALAEIAFAATNAVPTKPGIHLVDWQSEMSENP